MLESLIPATVHPDRLLPGIIEHWCIAATRAGTLVRRRR